MNDDNPSSELPTQAARDELAEAIRDNDVTAVEKILRQEPLLANADLRPSADRNVFSFGLPLHRACQHNCAEIAKLLLDLGAHPDAPGPDPNDQPVLGMPLHFAAAEHRNYELANLLLDRGATPNSYPNCDKATIERVFYQAREAGLPNIAVRRAFARFLPDKQDLEKQTLPELVSDETAQSVQLFARMVTLGAETPLVVLVREGFHDLAMEVVTHSRSAEGTLHDHPNSTAVNNISGAARWYGYPSLVRRLMEHPDYCYSYADAISTISTAIGSHNRDGNYADYREIIVLQLEALAANGDLEEARNDPDFQPHFHIATDFTWHDNYGYRAEIAEPACYSDLAELFLAWGFDNLEYRAPDTGHSPLSAAVKRGHHPGIENYIAWLLQKGVDLRQADDQDVNPLSIAREKELSAIQALLEEALH